MPAPRHPRAPTPPRLRLDLAPARPEASLALDNRSVRPRGADAAASINDLAPFVPWPQFRDILRRIWKPGPPDWPNTHMAIVGKSRSGKSTFTREIADMRTRVVVFGTKMVDQPLYDPLIKRGYRIQSEWDPQDTSQERVIFRPPLGDPSPESIARQREAFRRALVRTWQVGGWTIWFDEIRYLSETLKLQNELNLLWLQGGSMGVTILGLTQRPVSVPINMFEQSRFLVTFRISGVEDRRTMAGYAGTLQPAVFEIAAMLPPRELLFADTELDLLMRTRVILPGRSA